MQTKKRNLHILPDCYLITGAEPTDKERFLNQLEMSLDSGIKLVQLRAKSLSDVELQSLAEGVLRLCRRRGVRCLLNAPPELAVELGADGVHLTGQQLQTVHRRPLSSEYLVGASCHAASDLTKAMDLELDFVVLSPVLATVSHPQARPLGWSRFAELVMGAGLPVYALGGMRPDMITEARNNGAHGVAGISGFWG